VTEPVHCVVTVHQSEVELSRRNKICALSPLPVESFTWLPLRLARNWFPFSSPHSENNAAISAVVVPNNGLAMTPLPSSSGPRKTERRLVSPCRSG
jgi:hypothetical protein